MSSAQATPRSSGITREWHSAVVTRVSAAISVVALLYYFRRGELLLYRDAVAHINIARRVFDSLTPGLSQLGTVWLPLPHLLITPFIVSDRMWRSGVGAAIPSMVAFVCGAAGIYRLTREALQSFVPAGPSARSGGLLAATIFFCNPNLIYLQTTAMNEVVYLGLFIWALVWLQRFARSDAPPKLLSRALIFCGILLCAGALVRYEGWWVSALSALAVAAILIGRRGMRWQIRVLTIFLVLAAAAPIFWLAYNRLVYGNALEFAKGQYSARAIQQRSLAAGGAQNPAENNPAVATEYFGDAVLGNLGEWRVASGILFAVAIAGTIFLIARRRWLLLLLWAPLPFYVYSIAYGSVPIFLPNLWPWSYYNVRYGTALLPAIAVFIGIAVISLAEAAPRARRIIFAASFALVTFSYLSTYFQPHHRERHYALAGEPGRGPLTWREAVVNAVPRGEFDRELARELAKLPPQSRLLMSVASDVGALQAAGIPLRRVVNEANSRPLSASGLWNDALRDPAAAADFIVAVAGDPVAAAVARHPQNLEPVAEITAGEGHGHIYRSTLGASH
jgi:hypothetical protein